MFCGPDDVWYGALGGNPPTTWLGWTYAGDVTNEINCGAAGTWE
jgi:hypothetical protein